MMVTVALGDNFRVSIVRAVMRAMILLARQAGRHVIAVSEEEGIRRLLEGAGPGPGMPKRSQIEADLAAMHAELEPKAA
jgi:hypothetical protein